MTERLVPPDEQVLRTHLESGRFRSGEAAGRWRLVSLAWPYVLRGTNQLSGAALAKMFCVPGSNQCEVIASRVHLRIAGQVFVWSAL